MIEFIIMAKTTMHRVFVCLEWYFQGTLAYRLQFHPLHKNAHRLRKRLQ